MFKLKQVVMSLAISGVLTATTAINAQTDTTNFSPEQKKQIETLVHDYIVNHPNVIFNDSYQAFQQKQMDDVRKTFQQIQDTASKYADPLFHQATDPSFGDANAPITIVEFFDYQCPHCIDVAPVVEDFVKKNKNVRVVLKEFPIRGPNSEFASKAALAAQKQGKYFEFHQALMASKKQPLTKEVVFEIAQSVGLNIDQLKRDIEDKSISQQLKATYDLSGKMKIVWTPVFFVAKSNITTGQGRVIFIPGAIDAGQLTDAIGKV